MSHAADELRHAVRWSRIYTGEAIIAAERVAAELDVAELIIDRIRAVAPDLLEAVEQELGLD